ncbi:MAG: hypothetical protein QOJ65_2258 [Fimbriimonadaceae bacterium]|jgi:hypothetical protein|nr:hypothetical protein [Fimbriimonadaceae bacterium]
MSTLRTLTLSVCSLAAITAIAMGNLPFPQTGVKPVKIEGPDSVSPGGSYTYRVVVAPASSMAAAAVPFDTTVAIDDSSGYWAHPATVTIPAGATGADFTASVYSDSPPSLDMLQATNANGGAAIVVLVN